MSRLFYTYEKKYGKIEVIIWTQRNDTRTVNEYTTTNETKTRFHFIINKY